MVLSAAFLCTALSRSELFAETVPESLIDRTLNSAMRVRQHLTTAELAPESSAEAQEALPDRPDRLPSSGMRPKTGITKGVLVLALMMLLAVVSVGFAVTSLLLNDPSTLPALKNRFWSLSHGQWSQVCH
jgi:hypothetical protein